MLAIQKAIQPVWTNRFRAAASRKAEYNASVTDEASAASESSKRTNKQDVPRFLGIRISTLMHPAHLG